MACLMPLNELMAELVPVHPLGHHANSSLIYLFIYYICTPLSPHRALGG